MRSFKSSTRRRPRSVDDDVSRAVQAAVRAERERLRGTLVKLRHQMLGQAHACRSARPYVADAFEACATMVSDFVRKDIGETNGEE